MAPSPQETGSLGSPGSIKQGGEENKKMSSSLVFFVNGKKVVDPAADPGMTLLTYLRIKLRLCGTKLGCGEGGCGACTVMVSKYNRTLGKVDHLSVNACLAPAVSMHGLAVTTVEGIGNAKGRLHTVQQRLADSHGSQCGFCTPGIVMSMYTLLRNNPLPTMQDMETYFQGNLCRCTGYRPILEGFRTLTEEWTKFGGKTSSSESCGREGGCCKDKRSNETESGSEGGQKESDDNQLFNASEFVPYDPTQEPLFPPELIVSPALDNEDLVFRSKTVTWYRPTSFSRLLELKHQHPSAKIVVGNTELGVEVKFKHCSYPVFISPTAVPELTGLSVDEAVGLTVGSAVSLSSLEATCLRLCETMPAHKTRILKEIISMLNWFAGKQIRNVAALGGNIMTGSPISDLNPILMAANSRLVLRSRDKQRCIPFDENFYTGYRKNIVAPSEILESITIPFTEENQFFVAYKQARRRDDDIAIVNAAFNTTIEEQKIKNIRMAFGGMGPTTLLASKTMEKLKGCQIDDSLVESGCESLQKELCLTPDAPGAMVRYRQSLVLSFFFKTYVHLKNELGLASSQDKSAIQPFNKEPLKSHQLFEVKADDGVTSAGALGKPIKHKSADHQVCGTAQYTDDIPQLDNQLYAALVLSTKAHAEILSIDTSKALAEEGVFGWVDSTDLKDDRNQFGTAIIKDEVVFAEKYVYCIGMVIGVVLACDQETAQRAARLVSIQYKDLPAIITIEEAINANSFHPMPNTKIECGDVDAVMESADNIIQGEMRTGAQEQFYLETNACIAIPKIENDEIEIWSSTQNPTLTQKVVAGVLGIQANRVSVHVKRLGGGFGGKETRAIPIAAAIAAAADKAARPVRIMLDRDEDMLVSGMRHPFLGKYKVAYDKTGKVLALDVEVYANAGWSMDLTFSVVERAMFHSDNSYKVPNLRVRGFSCKTNLPSNTAFRGFGGPQGLMIAETWVEKIAEKLNMDPETVRERNLYQEGMTTHFNQVLVNCTLARCWQECKQLADFDKKKNAVDLFNSQNRWRKRGISMVPVKFGIAFTAVHMNQSGALVSVFMDGSVLVSHGGTEMGQGLHTKMIQVASQAFGIPHTKIHISETCTDKVPNTSPTAASAGSDLNGAAVLAACDTINARLQPFKDKDPDASWEDLIQAAYFARVSLSSTGFHATPDIGYDFKTNSGNPFNYFTYGAACSVVEIDCLTGDHQVLSTDIVMDLGNSINPAIDIGQVEGAFMQGYGLFLLEQVVHSPAGSLLTRGPGAYKIPAFNDIPAEFNVSLLRGAANPRAVYSSKAVGEPPLFLAASVFFGVKAAIRAARAETGRPAGFALAAPATAERIRMACEDGLTERVGQLPPEGSFKPWAIQV